MRRSHIGANPQLTPSGRASRAVSFAARCTRFGVIERGDRGKRRKPGRAGELLADAAFQLRADEQRDLRRLTQVLDQRADLGLGTAVQHESTDPQLQRTSDVGRARESKPVVVSQRIAGTSSSATFLMGA